MAQEKKTSPVENKPIAPNVPILITYQLKSHQIRIKDSSNISFQIDFNDPNMYSSNLVYKVYYCVAKRPKVLLSSGFSKPKKTLKIKAKFSLVHQIPSFIFNFRCEIFSNNKRLAFLDTELCTLVDYKLQSHFKVKSLECVSPFYIPNNPIVFWLIYSADLLPEITNLKIITKLVQEKQVLEEQVFPIQIGQKKAFPYLKYPLRFISKVQPKENEDLALLFEISEEGQSSTLYTDKINLMPLLSANGVAVSHVGYKRDIYLGEVAYLIAEIENKTDSRMFGRIELFYFTQDTDLLPIYKRKFHIDADNRDVISEDEALPDMLGGRDYWVLGRYALNLKKKGLAIAGEALSQKSFARIKNSAVFNVKINFGTNSDYIYFNDIIPIGIDIRVESNHKLKNFMCEIIEDLEGLSQRVLYVFKIKDHYSNDSFRWKIPPTCASVTLTARIIQNKISVESKNINLITRTLEILPPDPNKKESE
jgi:hypothetical protein